MAEITGNHVGRSSQTADWEKPRGAALVQVRGRGERLKFLIGGVLILSVVVYLIISGTASGARYFITVDNLLSNPEYVGQTVRISGAVLGESISYDAEALRIEFTIANVPEKYDNLAVALHEAVNNPDAKQLRVVVENQPKPDLLQHEAQAILTGKLGEDGVFYASELLLKCPSRFEEAEPGKAIVQPEAGA